MRGLLAKDLILKGTRTEGVSKHPIVIGEVILDSHLGFLAKLVGPFLLTSEQGAKTTIFLASDRSVGETSGKYFDACKEKKPSRAALDADAAKRLWDASEALV